MGSLHMLWFGTGKNVHSRAEGFERPFPRYRPTFSTPKTASLRHVPWHENHQRGR